MLNSYRKSSSPLTILKRIDSILFYHEKLKGATILNMDAYYIDLKLTRGNGKEDRISERIIANMKCTDLTNTLALPKE